jgi:hypothetical protein
MNQPILLAVALQAVLASAPALAAEDAPPAPPAAVVGSDDAALSVAVPRYALSGATVAVKLSLSKASAKAKFSIAVVTDTDRKRHVRAHGRLTDGGMAMASIALPDGPGDHMVSLFVTVAGAGGPATTELLRVVVLDPTGDYDADRIPSAEEINLWWTDPTAPNLGCRPADQLENAALLRVPLS